MDISRAECRAPREAAEPVRGDRASSASRPRDVAFENHLRPAASDATRGTPPRGTPTTTRPSPHDPPQASPDQGDCHCKDDPSAAFPQPVPAEQQPQTTGSSATEPALASDVVIFPSLAPAPPATGSPAQPGDNGPSVPQSSPAVASTTNTAVIGEPPAAATADNSAGITNPPPPAPAVSDTPSHLLPDSASPAVSPQTPPAPNVARQGSEEPARFALQPTLPGSRAPDSPVLETHEANSPSDSGKHAAPTDEVGKRESPAPAHQAADRSSPPLDHWPSRMLAQPDATTPGAGSPTRADQTRFLQRIARAVATAPHGAEVLRLRLHPPELGSLSLQVSLQRGILTARLETETPAAHTMLLDNLPQLRQRLTELGVNVARFDIDLTQRDSGGSSSQPEYPRQPWRLAPTDSRSADAIEAPTETDRVPLHRFTRSPGGLNVVI